MNAERTVYLVLADRSWVVLIEKVGEGNTRLRNTFVESFRCATFGSADFGSNGPSEWTSPTSNGVQIRHKFLVLVT